MNSSEHGEGVKRNLPDNAMGGNCDAVDFAQTTEYIPKQQPAESKPERAQPCSPFHIAPFQLIPISNDHGCNIGNVQARCVSYRKHGVISGTDDCISEELLAFLKEADDSGAGTRRGGSCVTDICLGINAPRGAAFDSGYPVNLIMHL